MGGVFIFLRVGSVGYLGFRVFEVLVGLGVRNFGFVAGFFVFWG